MKKRALVLLAFVALAAQARAAVGIGNHAVSNVVATQAVVYAIINYTNNTPATGTVYYGTYNYGTNAANWPTSSVYGAVGATGATINVTLTGLSPASIYFYRWKIADTGATAWASSTSNFITSATAPTSTITPEMIAVTAGTNGVLRAPTNFYLPDNTVSTLQERVVALEGGASVTYGTTDTTAYRGDWGNAVSQAVYSAGAGATNLAYAIGAGATNYADAVGAAVGLGATTLVYEAAAGASNLAWEIGAGTSNYADSVGAAVGLGATNLALAIGAGASNLPLWIVVGNGSAVTGTDITISGAGVVCDDVNPPSAGTLTLGNVVSASKLSLKAGGGTVPFQSWDMVGDTCTVTALSKFTFIGEPTISGVGLLSCNSLAATDWTRPPNTIGWCAKIGADHVLTNGAACVLHYDTMLLSNSVTYDTNAFEATIAVAGVYDLSANFRFRWNSVGKTNANCAAWIEVGSARVSSVEDRSTVVFGANYFARSLSASIPLDIGDVVRVKVYQEGGNSTNLSAVNDWTFSGTLKGK